MCPCLDCVLRLRPALFLPCLGVRQLLAHAHQLLEAAGTEPQWLRHGERHFHVAPWTKLVAATQLVALRQAGLQQDLLIQ